MEVNSAGKKLSRKDIEKKIAQELHQIKTMLIQVKKDEEKQEQKLEKLDKMLEQLETKNNDKEYELSEQVDNAKEKGIALNVKSHLNKRQDELKMKVGVLQNHCKSLEGLTKTKVDNGGHEIEQIKIAGRNVDSQIRNLCHSIEHSQEESIKYIKKAKENPKLPPHIIEGLDRIMKSIEESQQNNYFDVRS